MYGAAREQRCWVHKTANVLNKLSKGLQAKAQQQLHAISIAETRHAAEAAFDAFVDAYAAKYDKAVACLVKDCKELLTFYDFPSTGSGAAPVPSRQMAYTTKADAGYPSGKSSACIAVV